MSDAFDKKDLASVFAVAAVPVTIPDLCLVFDDGEIIWSDDEGLWSDDEGFEIKMVNENDEDKLDIKDVMLSDKEIHDILADMPDNMLVD
jgi:hypothetical protein